ncbi:hypothetical protein B0H14DRAFT_3882924 [Mycena olivaceomarginata]|nr:hypothetical protein B0H14DRAFT_3882924 [Mycena olivaceomarginata]
MQGMDVHSNLNSRLPPEPERLTLEIPALSSLTTVVHLMLIAWIKPFFHHVVLVFSAERQIAGFHNFVGHLFLDDSVDRLEGEASLADFLTTCNRVTNLFAYFSTLDSLASSVRAALLSTWQSSGSYVTLTAGPLLPALPGHYRWNSRALFLAWHSLGSRTGIGALLIRGSPPPVIIRAAIVPSLFWLRPLCLERVTDLTLSSTHNV